jgi:hypothetical protein
VADVNVPDKVVRGARGVTIKQALTTRAGKLLTGAVETLENGFENTFVYGPKVPSAKLASL